METPDQSRPALAQDAVLLALDRVPSSRIFDKDGHLHVERVHITKAGVSPYRGAEIPHWRELGLDPARIYHLFRDPAELERGVRTLNNKPLLFGHNPVHAEAHDHTRTVGTVSNPVWNPPYVDGDMAVWAGPAIDCIRDDSQKELSSSYHYKAVMEPGSYEGQAFDGRMVDIAFNHVGLVPKGRVGPDCVVSDSAETVLEHLTAAAEAANRIVAARDASDATNGRAGPATPRGALTERLIMSKTALSGAGALTQGALLTYLRPRLAQDAKLDLGPIVSALTAKNFKTSVPTIVLGVQRAARGKLAQDADLDDLPEVVEALVEAAPPELVDAIEQQMGDPADGTGDPAAEDDGGDAKAFLKAKGLSDEDIEKVMAMLGGAPAMDRAAVSTAVQAATKGMVSKPAMDAAIDAAVTRARTQAAVEQRAIREAERAVHPWIGDLAMAHDSAEDVYRTALTALKVDIAGVDPSAYPAILKLTPKPGEVAPRPTRLAMDAAQAKSFEERFGTARIGHAA